VLGFGVLILLLMIVTITNVVIEQAISRPANEAMKEANDDILLASRIGFEFERARYEERIFETFYRAKGFDQEEMATAYAVVLDHLGKAVTLMNSVDMEGETSESIARIEALRNGLETYTENIDKIVSELLPARGSTTIGMGADIYRPLQAINASVDTTEAMALVESYVTNFTPEAVMALPQALADIRQRIQDADLPTDRKDVLLKQVDDSQSAFSTLLAFDGQILLRYTEIGTATEALAEDGIGGYIAAEEQEQREAQARLDDANRIREIVGWAVTGLTLAIALVMSTLIARSVTRPIAALNQVARRVAEGDYSQRAPVTTTNELGQLARSFNETIAAVGEREHQLREQTEQLRIATARAKEAARIKGEFLANVSHELRTPLNAIIGFSDMLLMGMSGELNEKQAHKVTRLRENGIRLLDLINDILDLTRIEARRVELVPKPFATRALFLRRSGQMESLAHDKGLEFAINVAPDLPETLVGDEKRIEQVVVNLLSNAFKFTQQGSVILRANVNHADNTWAITVSDTGIGIPPHAKDLIFEEFRQLDGTSTRAFKGTGLGLAITRNLVRIMGGEISVESELGKGSVFTVTLPLTLEDAVTEKPAEIEAVEA